MKFTEVKHKSGNSHFFKVYSIKDFYKDFSKEDLEELTGYEVEYFKSEEDENIEPQLYTLQKEYLVVITRYSIIIFPKIKDLLFTINARKKARKWAKRNVPR